MNWVKRLGLIWWLFAAISLAQSGDLGILEIRLATPLTSYDTGSQKEFRAVVIAPLQGGDHIWLPAGTVVFGKIRHSTKVGIGIIHERASLELDFDSYELADGRRFSIAAKLVEVENAREEVTAAGKIKGILAAANPQSLLGGFWHRPSTTLFQHSVIGLTGLTGRIWSGYSLGPVGAGALFAARCLMFRMPEPEIQLPSGTEMKIRVTRLSEDAPSYPVPEDAILHDGMPEWLRDQPYSITTKTGKATEDLINVAFSGSREQLKAAFQAAGWVEASRRTARSVSHMYTAYSRQAGYAVAPASKLKYEGADPDLIFEKSFNTITKRHHVRIWRVERDGSELWMGAATHDVGIAFQVAGMKFTHKIDAEVDLERSKIVNDLAFAGCAGPAAYVERAQAARAESDANYTVTDGRIAFIPLTPCSESRKLEPDYRPKPPVSILLRVARRIILEGRQYAFRENPYYWAYRAVIWSRQESSYRRIDPHD